VLGPKLRTYAESIDERGGVPWRRFDASDRWFLPAEEPRPALVGVWKRCSPPRADRGVNRHADSRCQEAGRKWGFVLILDAALIQNAFARQISPTRQS
jgi:hypothetical protein